MPRGDQRNAEMRRESRAQIIAAARRLFAERGYFACRVADIAREAGMSAGNLYWYFAGKEDVLRAVLSDGFAAQAETLEDVARLDGSGREQVEAAVLAYIRLCEEQGEFVTILVSLLGHGGPDFLAQMGFDTRQIGAAYHARLAPVFARARAEGAVADVKPERLVAVFLAFFNGLMITYGDDWRTLSPPVVRDGALRLLGADRAHGLALESTESNE